MHLVVNYLYLFLPMVFLSSNVVLRTDVPFLVPSNAQTVLSTEVLAPQTPP